MKTIQSKKNQWISLFAFASLFLTSCDGDDKQPDNSISTLPVPENLQAKEQKITGIVEVHFEDLGCEVDQAPKLQLLARFAECNEFCNPRDVETETVFISKRLASHQGSMIYSYKYTIVHKGFRGDSIAAQQAADDLLIRFEDDLIKGFDIGGPLAATFAGLISIRSIISEASGDPNSIIKLRPYSLDLSSSLVQAYVMIAGKRFNARNPSRLKGYQININQTESTIDIDTNINTAPTLIISVPCQGPGSSGGGQTDGGTP